MWHRRPTRRAPRRPKIDKHVASCKSREFDRPVVSTDSRKIRRRRAGREQWRMCGYAAGRGEKRPDEKHSGEQYDASDFHSGRARERPKGFPSIADATTEKKMRFVFGASREHLHPVCVHSGSKIDEDAHLWS